MVRAILFSDYTVYFASESEEPGFLIFRFSWPACALRWLISVCRVDARGVGERRHPETTSRRFGRQTSVPGSGYSGPVDRASVAHGACPTADKRVPFLPLPYCGWATALRRGRTVKPHSICRRRLVSRWRPRRSLPAGGRCGRGGETHQPKTHTRQSVLLASECLPQAGLPKAL